MTRKRAGIPFSAIVSFVLMVVGYGAAITLYYYETKPLAPEYRYSTVPFPEPGSFLKVVYLILISTLSLIFSFVSGLVAWRESKLSFLSMTLSAIPLVPWLLFIGWFLL